MTHAVTLGLWVHAVLAAGVVMEHGHSRNPIWLELRMSLAVVTTAALWCALEAVR